MSPAWITRLDLLHARHATTDSPTHLSTRAVSGHVFGADMPAYIIFHAMLGYALLAVALAALALRLPLRAFRRRRWLHHHLGYLWLFGTIWMPTTAIWCVYRFTGWDIIAFFIFSMYAAIQLGWLCMRLYRAKLSQFAEANDIAQARKVPKTVRMWKLLHAVCMLYSLLMLLGAGISFPFRANEDYERLWREYGAI